MRLSIKRWVPVVFLAGLAIAGCGPTQAGSAAVVGDQRLTDSQLAQTTSRLSEALGIPQSPQVTQAVLSRWMVDQLVTQLAASVDVDVTKGEVDALLTKEAKRAGGREALEQSALQAGLLPDMIPGAVRTTLLIQALSKATVSPQDPTGEQGLVGLVQQFSQTANPEVSPRYGTWDAQQLSVGALPDDLSTPISGNAGLGEIPQIPQ